MSSQLNWIGIENRYERQHKRYTRIKDTVNDFVCITENIFVHALATIYLILAIRGKKKHCMKVSGKSD